MGGPSRSVTDLSIALAETGIAVAVWTAMPQDKGWTNPLNAAGVELFQGNLDEIPLASPEGTIVHDHGIWLPSNHRVAVFATARKLRRVVSPRGMLEPWALAHRRWKKRIAWAAYQRCDLNRATALHATASPEAQQLCRLKLRPPVFVVPNGIAGPEGTLAAEPSKNGCRRALFLSRIHPKKGLRILVEAWRRVRPRGWQMIIVGPDEGGHRQEIERLVRDAQLDNAWSFHDQAEGHEKWRLLSSAELFVLPTHSENFGNVVVESLLAGVPVVTTTGAPWRGLAENRCGWWVKSEVDDLAMALREATSCEAATLRGMGDRGREWAKQEFAPAHTAAKMITAYESVLGAQVAP
jgi:glycosyltransferase involved in cell wall biosynthesis